MAQRQAPSDDFELESLLHYLKARGFPCGVGERVRAYRLYAAFAPHSTRERMKTVLCPVFARSERDQEEFYRAYDEFLAEPGGMPSHVPPTPFKGLGAHEVLQPQSQPSDSAGGWPSRRTLALAVLVPVLAIGGTWLAGTIGQRISQPPTPVVTTPPPAPRPGLTIRQYEETQQTNYTRPCQGVECVTRGARPWVIAGALVLLAAALVFARSRWFERSKIRAREERRGPPFSWPVFRHADSLDAYASLLTRTADAMRQRLAGEAEDLDIGRTIDATINKAGYPTLRFRPRKKAPDYLFLIEQQQRDDHFACWWTDISTALHGLGVSTRTFHYSGDLRRATEAGSSTAISTLSLLDRFADSRVLVVGRGRDLLQGLNDVPGWIDAAIVRRDQRALLTAAASFAWGRVEESLSARMPVVPARLGNLASAVAGTAAGSPWRNRETVEMPEIPADYFDETEDAAGGRPGLARYLDDDVFQWLCACAAYPRLEWPLTLRIAAAIDPSGALLREEKLLQLIRLAWFRRGRIPGQWRSWLLKHLAPENATITRRLLLAALEHNRAPMGSFARDLQDVQIAAQRHWLAPDARTHAELRASFDGLPDVDIAEDPLLAPLRTVTATPAAERLQLERARLARMDWKVPATVAASMAAVLLVMRATPVADTRTDSVMRYEQREDEPKPPVPPAATPVVYILLDKQGNPAAGRRIASLLGAGGFETQVPSYRVSAPRVSQLRYFFAADAAGASVIGQQLQAGGVRTTVAQISDDKAVPGRYELWVAADVDRAAAAANAPAGKTPDKAPAQNAIDPYAQQAPPQAQPLQSAISYEDFATYVADLAEFMFDKALSKDPKQTTSWSVGVELEKLLRESPGSGVLVIGHAAMDEGNTSATRRTLALERANAVRDSLIAQTRGNAQNWTARDMERLDGRFRATAGSDTDSKCNEPTAECAQQNRRVALGAFRYGASAK